MSSDPVSPTPPEPDRSARRNAIVGVAVMVCLLALFIWAAMDTLNRAAERERVINAVNLMAAAIATFIHDTGRWPSSADELANVGPISIGAYTWPTDRDEILSRVVVDYDVKLSDVVATNKQRFRAVRPADPQHEDAATKNAFDRILPVARAVVDANPMLPE